MKPKVYINLHVDADELMSLVDTSMNRNEHRNNTSDMSVLDFRPVVHAKWIDKGDCHRCSNCMAILEEDFNWRYHQFCYHCGAIMDER